MAFIGAGGKTTSLFGLARELGRPTLVTTTTHLGAWQARLADRHVIARSLADLEDLGEAAVTLVTGPAGTDQRLSSVPPSVLGALRGIALAGRLDLLIEADGAHQKALKAPGPQEPQIPDFVDTVIVVAGMHGLDAVLNDSTVHRPRIFAQLSGLRPGDPVTSEGVVRVMVHERGGLRGIPTAARRVALLNQADTQQLQARAHGMADGLLQAYGAVIVANVLDQQVSAIYERCAGIVLAAGGATRFGAPKQLVRWHNEPLVRIAAKTALDAGLSPVVVVTGASSDQVRQAVEGLSVETIENPKWQEGQGSSVRCGVAAIPNSAGAAVFLLADQPMVTPAVVQALVEAHASEDACIVAPLIEEGQRANPVLFDRETFDRLRALTGDVGGRSIFPDFKIHYVPWHDAGILRDIDTQDEYNDLLGEDQ